MIKPGKKTKEWNKAKRILKPAFEKAGITSCELLVSPNCTDFALSWAHGDKRANLTYEELYKLVAVGCVACHGFIEKWPRLKMRAFIKRVIKNRPIQPEINLK